MKSSKVDPFFQTDRLVLRPLQAPDALAVFSYASDPQVAENTAWPTHTQLADAEQFIAHVLGKENLMVGQVYLTWGLINKASQEVIGTLSFVQDSSTEGHVDYALARQYWSRGLMSEALHAAIAWAFREIPDLQLIRSGCLTRNFGSVRVLEKAGFRLNETYRSKRGGKFKGEELETSLFIYTP